MAVLGPGRCPIGFPEAVRSILTNSRPKPAHENPIRPLFYTFSTNFRLSTLAFPAFGIYSTGPRALLGHQPAPPALLGGEGFALAPRPPPPEVLEGLRPSNSPKSKIWHMHCGVKPETSHFGRGGIETHFGGAPCL